MRNVVDRLMMLFADLNLPVIEVRFTRSFVAFEFNSEFEARRAQKYFDHPVWTRVAVEEIPRSSGHFFVIAHIEPPMRAA